MRTLGIASGAVGYAVVVDAPENDGPADPSRIDLAVCAQPFMPGVDPATFPQDWAAYLAQVGEASREHEPMPDEPPLQCYVTASCAEPAPDVEDEGDSTTPPAPDPGSLPATDGGAAAGVVVLLTLSASLRRRR